MDRVRDLGWAIAAATLIPLVGVPVLHVSGALTPVTLAPLLLLGAPHVLSTLGLYADAEIGAVVRRRPRWFAVAPLAAIPVAVALFGVARGPVVLLLVAGFFAWQVQHYTKQNVGMFAFWCRSQDLAAMDERERSLIRATTVAGVIGILRAVELVPAWSGPLQALGLAVIAVLVASVAVRPAGVRSIALVVAACFYLPLLLSAPGLLGVAFAYQASHGAQYYLMVARTLAHDRRARWVAVVAVAVGGVIAVSVLAPAVLVTAPVLYGLGKGLAVSHFIADARLWRLRDPELGPILRRRFGFDQPGAPPRQPVASRT